MRKYYVIIRECVFEGQTYFEAVTCIIDFGTMKFRRIINLSEFLSFGEGLSESEEDYKRESFKVLDYRTRSLDFKS